MQANRLSSPQNPEKSLNSVSIRPMIYLLMTMFVIGALLYGVIVTGREPATVLQIFTTRFLGIFIEAVPFLLLGTLTSGLIEVFIHPDDLIRWLPKNKVLATITGAFLGIIFPVCECGVVPVARRLFTKGLPVSMGIAFLLAAPFMNPIVFASTYIAFGFGTVFIGRFIITAIVAISVGLLFAFFAKPEDVLQPASMQDFSNLGSAAPQKSGFWQGIGQSAGIAGDEFYEMGRFLVLGCLMAAAMQTFVPQSTLLDIGQGSVTSVLAMQALAFILSVCSTVDAFLALAFTTTFSTGAILAFLSFGPMVDVKSTLMFMGVFKRRTVAYLILLPFLMNLIAGIFVNLNTPAF
ncbi:MAG: permease [Aggregatilineales bacterium]